MNKIKMFGFLFLACFLSFLNACDYVAGPATGVKVKYPNEVQAPWKEEFRQAEKVFDAKNYKEAEKSYAEFVKKYPYNALTDKSEFRLGQIAMLNQDYGKAIGIFQSLIKKTPDPEMKAKSQVKLGICFYRQKSYGETLATFGNIDAKYLDDHEKVKAASLALSASSNLKEELNKKAYYYAMLYDAYAPLSESEISTRYGSEVPSKSEVFGKFKEWVALVTPPETLDKRLVNYRGKSSGPLIEYKLGKSYYEAKDKSRAQNYLKNFVSRYPNHEYASEASKMLAALGASIPQNKGMVAVGVILPLSGKYEQYGNSTLRGMECAVSAKPECKGINNIRLVVKDSAGDPAKAVALMEELINKDKVLAILGPLPSGEAEAVAKESQNKNITVLTLAQKKGLPALSPFLFRFSLTPAVQVDALLRYATNDKKLKRFAVLYPNSNYGQEFATEFEKTVSEFNGKLVSKVSFSPSKADPSLEIRQLKLNVSEMKEGAKPFDALFIPDSYLTIAKLAPALASAGLNEVLLLGTNAWNDPSLPSRIGTSISQAVFVDVFYRDSQQAVVQAFVRDFQAAYAYPPSTLEAMGYDAARILGQALAMNKVTKREEVKAALAEMKTSYKGVTGFHGFRGDREAAVDPYMIGVDATGFKELK